jgi:peptidoglycan/xylan/chitin deacetylase (PgdA/CDA1 family)/glycosyltransferase involved in cell wall biosynthesis
VTNSPRFSIVIPTFQRRETVIPSVDALRRQTFSGDFEVIVVVDGSDDGSADALRSLDSFSLRVIEQTNQGASAARNAGAACAEGEILLFLDDDMEADPALLARHDEAHRDGATVVLGHIPLHPDSPRNFLSAGVARWAEDRHLELTRTDELTPFDLLTGQLSIRRDIFEALGGFSRDFTRGGSFGNEDLDFGIRLLNAGHRIDFAPEAISRQRYVVGFRQHLEQWTDVGRADVALASAHREQLAALRRLRSMTSPLNRVAKRLCAIPLIGKLATRSVGDLAVAAANLLPRSRPVSRLFHVGKTMAYWRGVAEQGGFSEHGRLRVLGYHSIDRNGGGALADYSLHPKMLERQLAILKRAGFTFVSPEGALAFVEGRSQLPRRSILLTFDDGYADFVEEVRPILKAFEVPAVVFVVTDRLGQTNDWDIGTGAPVRHLMSATDLVALQDASIHVGAHSRSHRSLVSLPDQELQDEVDGSIEDLAKLGLNGLKLFCYPYGEVSERVECEVAAAGVRAAFTVEPGAVEKPANPLEIPRIEILRRDGDGAGFLWKVWTAGRGLKRARMPGKLLSQA